jgi:ABC-type multidrug transport system ATPase subunit
MKQKLALCCALVHRPDILFLDEPTTGVDAVSRREFWDLLGELKRGGLTTIVSTPYMDEADRCDRVALIQRGTLLAVDTPGVVAQMFGRPLIAVRAEPRNQALRALRAYDHTATAYPFGSSIHFTDRRADVPAERQQTELRTFLEAQRLAHVSIELTAATVEDTFMARMGSNQQDGGGP